MLDLLLVVLLILLILAGVLVVGLLCALGVVGVGWIVSQVFSDLSLFEASLIAALVSGGVLFLAQGILRSLIFTEDTFDDDRDNEEFMEASQAIDQVRRQAKRATSGGSTRRKPGGKRT